MKSIKQKISDLLGYNFYKIYLWVKLATKYKFKKTKNSEYLLLWNNKQYFIRGFNTSDFLVFNQILVNQEFEPLIKILKDKPLVLIDLGANIGFTTVWMKEKLNIVESIGVEPDVENVNLYRKNNPNSLILQKAIAPQKGMFFSFKDSKASSWELSTQIDTSGSIEGITMLEVLGLCKKQEKDTLLFLKIDIEGAEFELFENNKNIHWLNKVDYLSIEIHENIGSKELVVDNLVNFGFVQELSTQEYLVFRNANKR